MSSLREERKQLDVVCVSHVDEDHIGGVVRMLEDEVQWRVHDYQRKRGNEDYPAPDAPRPPAIREMWHNGFGDQVGADDEQVEGMLSQCARVLTAASSEGLRGLAQTYRDFATDAGHGVRLSRRIGPRELDIPLNPPTHGKLMMLRDAERPISLGSMSVLVLGPLDSEVESLRKWWRKWLNSAKGSKKVKQIDEEAGEDEDLLRSAGMARKTRLSQESLRTPEISRVFLAALTQAEEVGRRSEVSVPNLASIVLLVEEAGKTVLLAGDGHAKDICEGLRRNRKLKSGHCHVDILKVPHHGSEHNLNEDFCKAVTADHYLFCANGEHQNPDPQIVKLIVDTRLKGSDDRKFKLWFNSSKAAAQKDRGDADHMSEIQRLVSNLTRKSQGRISSEFLKGPDSFELSLS